MVVFRIERCGSDGGLGMKWVVGGWVRMVMVTSVLFAYALILNAVRRCIT